MATDVWAKAGFLSSTPSTVELVALIGAAVVPVVPAVPDGVVMVAIVVVLAVLDALTTDGLGATIEGELSDAGGEDEHPVATITIEATAAHR